MTIEEFSSFIQTKSVGRWTSVSNEQLIERVYSASRRIGMDTVPLKWVYEKEIEYTALRRLDEHSWIRVPHKATYGTGEDVDIEEGLVDALAYLVLSGLELQRTKALMHLYYIEIENYNDNLINTHLSKATNNAERFKKFP